MVNAEERGAAIAPNTWVQISGAGLAPVGDSRTWQSSDFVNGKLPSQLDGVSVTVNGKSAYVYYISPTQVNILTPPDAISGPVQIVATNNGTVGATFTAQAQSASPSFLAWLFNGGPCIRSRCTRQRKFDRNERFSIRGSTTPAKPGESVVLYANGFGANIGPRRQRIERCNPAVLFRCRDIKIGGIAASVQFAGLVAPGQYQFNVTVPTSLADGDQLPITASSHGGQTTQSGNVNQYSALIHKHREESQDLVHDAIALVSLKKKLSVRGTTSRTIQLLRLRKLSSYCARMPGSRSPAPLESIAGDDEQGS